MLLHLKLSLLSRKWNMKRTRRDLNPRSPAPKAGALIQTGLRAQNTLRHVSIKKVLWTLQDIQVRWWNLECSKSQYWFERKLIGFLSRKSLKTIVNLYYCQNWGPVAQLGWSVRLITERSPVRIRLGPLADKLADRSATEAWSSSWIWMEKD